MRKFSKETPINKIFILAVGLIFGIYVISLLVPVLWTINVSFQSLSEYIFTPFKLAKKLQFSNYKIAFSELKVTVFNKETLKDIEYDIFSMFGFSLAYSGITGVLGAIVPSILAYAVAKYKFFGSKMLYKLAIIIMIIPVVGSLPSSIAIRRVLNIYDNFIPFLLTATGAFNFNFLLLYGVFKSMPIEYKEAASIDGAGHYTIMFKIYYPLAVPLLTALTLLGFMGSWNDYMTIILYLPSSPNLAVGVYLFQANARLMGRTTPQVLAGFLIIAIPTVLIWAGAQGVVSKRLVVGGLKG